MKKVSILVVEDEAELREGILRYLSIFCDNIYEASNGEEAFEIYKKHLPSIILTDINMPKFNGLEFIKKVRVLDKGVNIIILSAHTRVDDLLQAVPLNLVSYLVKPIEMALLKKTILKAMENISQESYILLKNSYQWNPQTKNLFLGKEPIELSSYETAFLDILILHINRDVSYEEIHLYINEESNYSLDAIFTLAKRVRQKTRKELIKSSFKFGYRIESLK